MKLNKRQVNHIENIGTNNISVVRIKRNHKYYSALRDDVNNKIISRQKWTAKKNLKEFGKEVAEYVKPKVSDDEEVLAYEIETQTSHETKGTSKTKWNGKNFVNNYQTSFSFRCEGIFANKPESEKLEKMVNGSLMGAWNSGKTDAKRFLKNSIYKDLTDIDNVMRGYTIREVHVKKSQITNRMSSELQVTNNGKRWVGKNA